MSNRIGKLFCVTTWGESHGPAIGGVLDGCPAGLAMSEEEIQQELEKRRPGKTPWTSPRKEEDRVKILSGVFEGQTTGAPISLLIENRDADSSSYDSMKEVLRPGHAQYAYLKKYGCFDHRGGGRASARETAIRVAFGAIAKKLLKKFGIEICTYLRSVERVDLPFSGSFSDLQNSLEGKALFCPHEEKSFQEVIEKSQKENDSVGGIVECWAKVPPGLGDPLYEKMESCLASAMMSIPATKGFEVGEGFAITQMRGSQSNDLFYSTENKISMRTNHSGGILGGITTGELLVFRVAFKPPSSIPQPQTSVNISGKETDFVFSSFRHDPCVAIRGVSVVEGMTALVLADRLLVNQGAQYDRLGK